MEVVSSVLGSKDVKLGSGSMLLASLASGWLFGCVINARVPFFLYVASPCFAGNVLGVLNGVEHLPNGRHWFAQSGCRRGPLKYWRPQAALSAIAVTYPPLPPFSEIHIHIEASLSCWFASCSWMQAQCVEWEQSPFVPHKHATTAGKFLVSCEPDDFM